MPKLKVCKHKDMVEDRASRTFYCCDCDYTVSAFVGPTVPLSALKDALEGLEEMSRIAFHHIGPAVAINLRETYITRAKEAIDTAEAKV